MSDKPEAAKKPTHYKHPVNGKIFPYSEPLEKRGDMLPMLPNADGKLQLITSVDVVNTVAERKKTKYLTNPDTGRTVLWTDVLAKNPKMIGVDEVEELGAYTDKELSVMANEDIPDLNPAVDATASIELATTEDYTAVDVVDSPEPIVVEKILSEKEEDELTVDDVEREISTMTEKGQLVEYADALELTLKKNLSVANMKIKIMQYVNDLAGEPD